MNDQPSVNEETMAGLRRVMPVLLEPELVEALLMRLEGVVVADDDPLATLHDAVLNAAVTDVHALVPDRPFDEVYPRGTIVLLVEHAVWKHEHGRMNWLREHIWKHRPNFKRTMEGLELSADVVRWLGS